MTTLAALRSLFSIGRATLVDDSDVVQRMQASFGPAADGQPGALQDRLVVLQHFGFTSRPPRLSEVLVAFLRGDRKSGVVLGSNHQPSRPKNLAEGDSALYDQRGAYVWLKAGGLVIDAAGLPVTVQNATTVTVKASDKVRVEAPSLECTGDVVARCDGTAISLQGVHDAYNAHKHAGVQTGGGVSGPTDHVLP